MIQNDTKQVVERSNSFPEQTFSIEASAKAFSILSDGLYSDKITAILRELSCNAYDAHVTSKKLDTPFHIKLPNTLEPNFSIRDYGTGLSDKDIKTIFTTYFKSTKTGTNDQIGCLGLGSKSPFCITDNFTVTSYFNGIKTIYSMFLNENEIPSVSNLMSEETTEPNGLEISFSVKSQNIYEFHYKTPNVFQYFKLKPRITGHKVDIAAINYVQSRQDNWGLRDADNWGKAKAVMGNVAYDISDASIEDLTKSEQAILKLNIDIFFNIGDLDVSASREKLSYNVRTKKAVKNKLTAIVTELAEEINKEITNCKSLWDAKVLLHKLTKGDMKIFRSIIDNISVTYNGVPIEMGEINISQEDLKSFSFTINHFERTYRSRNSVFRSQSITYIPPRSNMRFFVADSMKQFKPRLKKYINANASTVGDESAVKVYLIHPVVGVAISDVITNVKTKLGMADDVVFENLSSLPFDKIVRGSNGGGNYNPKTVKKIFMFDENSTSDKDSEHWDIAEPDITLGGVYVIIDRYRINSYAPHSYLEKYIKTLNLLDTDKEVEIYGIKQDEYDKTFKGLENWITVEKYTKSVVENYIKDNNLQDVINLNKALETAISRSSYNWNTVSEYRSYFMTYAKHLVGYVKYNKIITDLINAESKSEILNKAEKFANKKIVPDGDTVGKLVKEIKLMFDDIVKEFPMLTMVESCNYDHQIVADYITIMLKKITINVDNVESV